LGRNFPGEERKRGNPRGKSGFSQEKETRVVGVAPGGEREKGKKRKGALCFFGGKKEKRERRGVSYSTRKKEKKMGGRKSFEAIPLGGKGRRAGVSCRRGERGEGKKYRGKGRAHLSGKGKGREMKGTSPAPKNLRS